MFTGIHGYMGLKLSLESLEKDISFIIRPTNELTYDELQQENKQLKEVIDKIKHILNNQINYREFVDVVNDIEDILREVSK